MVESREGGQAVSYPLPQVNAKSLRSALVGVVDAAAHIVTDEHSGYPLAAATFASHQTVNHSIKEYSRKVIDNDWNVHTITTNTAESFFSLLAAQARRLRHVPPRQQEAPAPLHG